MLAIADDFTGTSSLEHSD